MTIAMPPGSMAGGVAENAVVTKRDANGTSLSSVIQIGSVDGGVHINDDR